MMIVMKALILETMEDVILEKEISEEVILEEEIMEEVILGEVIVEGVGMVTRLQEFLTSQPSNHHFKIHILQSLSFVHQSCLYSQLNNIYS